jgi:hypothetical protein
MSLSGINPNLIVGGKPLILQIILIFQKQLEKPLFRGHLGL